MNQSRPTAIPVSLLALIALVACPGGSDDRSTTLTALATSRYVATTGLDTNPGTSALPLRTIQKCASVSAAGDTCLIGAGTYRETVTPNSGVTFQPNGVVTVTVDGSNPVTGWTLHSGSIYKATVTLNASLLAQQVFASSVMLPEARWPNTPDDPMNPTWATMGNGTSITNIIDTNIPNINWAGAVVHMFSGDNPFAHQTGTVTSSGAGSVTFTAVNGVTCPTLCAQAGGKYYLVGKLAALDTAKEWFYDASTSTLYLWAAGGGVPANITAKRRDLAFDLRGKSNVTIKNIKLFASTITTNASSSGNTIDGLDAKYLSHYNTLPLATGLAISDGDWDYDASHANDSGIVLLGSGNILRNSILHTSAGNGVYLGGSTQTARNNLIRETGYGGSYATAVVLAGSGHTVERNTIFNTGRDGITISSQIGGTSVQNNQIAYNHIFNTAKLVPDSGGIYACCGLNATGTRIHHNWVHDITNSHPTSPTSGIYIDNASANFEIDQNVLWNTNTRGLYLHGLQNNAPGPSLNNFVHNNDFLSGSSESIGVLRVADATGTKIQNNKLTGTLEIVDAPAAGLVASNNVRWATGANDGYSNPVGCNFTGCTTATPPARPATANTSAYVQLEAESFASQSGVVNNIYTVGSFDANDWIRYAAVDFGGGANAIQINLALPNTSAGGQIEVRLDSATGPLVGTLTTTGTGGWNTYTTQTATLTNATGIRDVYLVSKTSGVGNLDWFRFTRRATTTIEAEDFNAQSGIIQAGTYAGSLAAGDWLRFDHVDFTGGQTTFTANLALDANQTKYLEVRLDSLTGPLIGTLATTGTGSWSVYASQSTTVSAASGVRSVYLVSGGGSNFGDLNWIKFGP